MARLVWFPGAIYHVSYRSAGNLTILNEESDFLHYLSFLEQVRYQYPFYLHSYCLMSNHIHLLIETIHVPVQDIMKKVNNYYRSYFRYQYNDILPHFFEQTTLIDSVDEFLTTSKKIHLSVTPFAEYRWSSYQAFISQTPNNHIITSRILTFFPEPRRKYYQLFVEDRSYYSFLRGVF